jgi:DNA-binding transcriptional LysR family regulator
MGQVERHDRIGRRLRLRDLHTLVAVARRGSMAKAAAELALTQPAVSKIIADMERALGVRLLDRKPQGVEPTPYGRALLRWGDGVFEDLRHAVREIDSLADPTGGEIRIGASGPMVEGLLPVVADRISRQHPRILFHVTQSANTAYLYEQLRARKFDFIIGRVPQRLDEPELHAEAVFEDPLHVVAGKRHRLARRRKLKLADLMDELWVLPAPESAIGAFAAEAFRASGLELPRRSAVCGSLQFTYAMMATGRYLGMFPASLLRFSGERFAIRVLSITLPVTPPPVAVVTLRNRTIHPAARLVIECIRAVVEPLARPGGKRG